MSRNVSSIIFGVLLLSVVGCSTESESVAQSGQQLSIVNLNLLHGFDCDPPVPQDGDQCRITERVKLLGEYLAAEQCPDIVTLQEIVDREFVQRSITESAGPLDSALELVEQMVDGLAEACGFRYQLVYRPLLDSSVAETDEELILSRYPVLHSELQPLHSALYDPPNNVMIFARHVLHARIDHPVSVVEVYTTHLSSGSDNATNNCLSVSELVPGLLVQVDCPEECDAEGTVRDCQARQLGLYAEQTRISGSLALLTGDFNATPGSTEYSEIVGQGWLDSHIAGGNAPCERQGDPGCTSGRDAESGELLQATRNQGRRIDYIFIDASPRCELLEAGVLDSEPNPFSGACGDAPLPTCWMSDHSANIARLVCR